MSKQSKTVTVMPGGKIFSVEEGESILDAAIRLGHAFPYSCRDGACGTCKGKLISGQVQYPGKIPPPGLKSGEQEQGFVLFCQASALTDITIEVEELSAMAGIPIKNLPCRVVNLEKLCHDVILLQLKLPQTENFKFLAGQYLDIIMKDGRRRSFSMANPPHQAAVLELHIRHVPGGAFSGYVFNELKEKTILRLRGPLGSFFLREETANPIIFVAGGTGFAPIKSIIEHALQQNITRPMHLFWGVRTLRDLYLADLAQSWTQQYPLFKFTPVLSHPLAEDEWQGETGWITQTVAKHYPDLSSMEIYAGGPPAMIQAGNELFFTLGLAKNHYFYDSFEYAKDKK